MIAVGRNTIATVRLGRVQCTIAAGCIPCNLLQRYAVLRLTGSMLRALANFECEWTQLNVAKLFRLSQC